MAGLSDSLAQSGINMPSLSVNGNVLANFGLYAIGFVLGVAFLGFLVWMWIRYKKYNQTLKVFRKINGFTMPVATERATFERIGLAGDYWCRTATSKKILPRPTIAMGKNVYWYYIREDGEWINFGIQDIDSKMKEAKAYYVDEDMRLQRLGIEKNLRQRYGEKKGFWKEYGGLILNIFFVLIIMVALILLFKEMGKLADKLGSVASAVQSLAEATTNMISRSSSGVIPA
jgi:hypothetical protein